MSHISPNAVPQLRKGALIQKVCAYLEKNPDEELTRSDIVVKFDVAATVVDGELKPAVDARRLVCARNDDDGLVWRLPEVKATVPAPFAAGQMAEKKRARARRAATFSVDLSSIQIRKGIPVFKREKRSETWNSLFRSMTDIEDSFVVPMAAHAAMCRAAAAYRKQHAPDVKFTVRKISGEECGIWRIV